MSLAWDCTPQAGLLAEFRAELESRGGAQPWINDRTWSVSPEITKLVLDEMLASAGVTVRYGTMLQGARVEGGRIVEISTASKSGTETWSADVFVDASGDGDLGAFAGCGFEMGRPSDGKLQPGSMNAVIGGWPADIGDGEALAKDILETLERENFELSYRKTRLFEIPGAPGLRRCMWTHLCGLDPTDADSLTAANIEGRRQVHAVVDCLRTSEDLRFADLFVAATGPWVAIREGRRIHGHYTLTIEDLREKRRFEDEVVRVAFNVDIHHVDPSEGRHLEIEKVAPYGIPYRCMVARDVDNLLMAGRCISGDFRAHGSYRTTSDCTAMGEVAGRAAARSAARGVPPIEVDLAAPGRE
jgi:hypothetical protein